MATPSIRRHAGDAKEQVHFHPTYAESRLQSRRHLCPECQPPQLRTISELKVSKSSICRPDMHFHIHLFHMLNCLVLVHLPRVASLMQIWSRYADWWRNIHWVVYYLLCGNAADIHFEHWSSRLSNPGSDDEHWSKGMGLWQLLSSTLTRHCKV